MLKQYSVGKTLEYSGPYSVLGLPQDWVVGRGGIPISDFIRLAGM